MGEGTDAVDAVPGIGVDEVAALQGVLNALWPEADPERLYLETVPAQSVSMSVHLSLLLSASSSV